MATVTNTRNPGKSESPECQSFVLMLSGFDEITDEISNALYDAGCDDALLGIRAGAPYLTFDREAPTLSEAITSAIRDVESCGLEIRVECVRPRGEETLNEVNALLKTRHQLRHKLEALSPDMAHRVDELLNAMLANNASAMRKLLKD